MSTGKGLVEEAKKRVVLLLICVFGLSYLMSLTSSSVWINFPVAATLILFGRYISLDYDVRKRAAASNGLSAASNKLSKADHTSHKRPFELRKSRHEKSNWRKRVNSPPVEAAIEQFTRHLISEWVTDLWYSRITPDRDGPEELVQIMNNVLGEISYRARDVNLINLLTRDIINLVCNHLELYRICQSKMKKQELGRLPVDFQDTQRRLVLAADNKLHPALFSAEAEHKVLQHLMNALILITFKPEDLRCAFFHYTVRELLACAVFRPVLNLANPRVINEKIESLVLSFANKANKEVTPSAEVTPALKPLPKPSADQLSGFQDRSTVGVELVQVRHDQSRTASNGQIIRHTGEMNFQKGANNSGNAIRNESFNSGGEWAQILDVISRRKTQVLAPENLENLWTKGRNYKKKEVASQVAKMGKEVAHGAFVGSGGTSHESAVPSNFLIQDKRANFDVSKRNTTSAYNEDHLVSNLHVHADYNGSSHHPIASYQEGTEDLNHEEVESGSESPHESDDDENNNVTGLDSPVTRVWDSKNKRNAGVSNIRHPLESSDFHVANKKGIGHVRHPRTLRTSSGRKRSRSSNEKVPIWQEVERTTILFGKGQDLLHDSRSNSKPEELSDDPESELRGRIHSGTTATSSQSSISTTESCFSPFKSHVNSVLADTFLKLRCEVLGANLVKSGSVTFAVYSIAVADGNNNSWSIKRRYRHFEELHRRLKEFAEYNLSLPPKHFLSSGLDVPIIQERCKLLDKYLKMLLQTPTVSGSIEVWDFLSVDSQTYLFSDSLSIIQTLSVNLDDKPYEKGIKSQLGVESTSNHSARENLNSVIKGSTTQMNKNNPESNSQGLRKRNMVQISGNIRKELKNTHQDDSGSDSEYRLQETVPTYSKSNKPKHVGAHGADILPETSPILETDDDSTIPTEWVPPNLSVPLLDLVDVVFQLQDGGWIRRKAFWVAKQLLQLGMGDAFDDWLIDKIQLLRRGSVIANAINRVEQILWPDGIFLTKHPNRKRPTPVPSPNNGTNHKDNKVENFLTPEEQLETARRAKFVYELIIEKAPAALVSLVGRKEYEHCAQDIYFFLQSPMCLKQLAFELLELILLSAFPELDDAVRQCHEEKEQFGAVEDNR